MVAAAMLIVGAACAGTGGRDTEASAAGGQAAAADSATHSLELTTERLDAFARGLRKEIEAVRASRERTSSAMTPEARGAAMQASFENATIPQGAEAAGLPVEQYREIRQTVHGILRTLDFQGKIDGPLSMDLSRADAATKERLSRDPLADLPPGSAAALRSQMDRLVPIWIEYVGLTAVAG
jgi:hypothetical protein